MYNEQRIKDALQVLYEEGLNHYKPEYRDEINRWEAIGAAISQETTSPIDTARLAYEHWEDWNYHNACAVLDWIFPRLHEMLPDSPAVDYMDTLKRVKDMIGRRPPMKVFTDWNNEKMEYNVETWALEVNLVKIDPSS